MRTLLAPDSPAPTVDTPYPGLPAPHDACRIRAFLDETRLPTPILVMDVEAVAAQYRALQQALPTVHIYYAVKANPLPAVVRALADLGSKFDVASASEIDRCLSLGIPARRLSFGHTVKKADSIARAHAAGLDLFACDSIGELHKIARHAPGARIVVRLLTDGASADWPLSRKFGCDPAMARDLLVAGARLGLRPYGLSFHVGSQQTDPGQWDRPISAAAQIFADAAARGIRLRALNLGGGFPAHYSAPIRPIQAYAAAIERSLDRAFGRDRPLVMVEPGRHLAADAGVIETEVVLVSRRFDGGAARWVYIDCGKFGGLAETMDEAIKYRVHVPGRHGKLERVVLAGPSCDSADILYERTACWLPADLAEGDRLRILAAGAYTYTYASVGFNGFAPLQAVCL
jgi:ornithine decarboxylase